MLESMDGERTSAPSEPAEPGRGRGASPKMPKWFDAIPTEMDVSDDLEVVARLSFRSLVTALVRVHADRFMPIAQRVQLISQINAQLAAAVSKRRLWLAEQVIKGNERAISEIRSGRALEMRDHAPGTNGSSEASRPTARRGRPRKR